MPVRDVLTVRVSVIWECCDMDLKQELTDYEIGGIGDIKKHTLRFRSYRIGTEGGKLMIYTLTRIMTSMEHPM